MPNFKNTPHAQALILLFIAMISMQSSGSLAKILFGQFPVLTVSVMRLLLGSLILAMIFKIWQINFRHVNWRAISSYGIALAGMNAMFYLSIERLPLGIAVSFEFIGPLGVALYYARQRYDFIWVGLAILGLVLLFPFDQSLTKPRPDWHCLCLSCGCMLGDVYYLWAETFRDFRQSYCVLRHVYWHAVLNARCTLCRDSKHCF